MTPEGKGLSASTYFEVEGEKFQSPHDAEEYLLSQWMPIEEVRRKVVTAIRALHEWWTDSVAKLFVSDRRKFLQMTTGTLLQNILGPAGKIIVAFWEGNTLVAARKIWWQLTPHQQEDIRVWVIWSKEDGMSSLRQLYIRWSDFDRPGLDERIIRSIPLAQRNRDAYNASEKRITESLWGEFWPAKSIDNFTGFLSVEYNPQQIWFEDTNYGDFCSAFLSADIHSPLFDYAAENSFLTFGILKPRLTHNQVGEFLDTMRMYLFQKIGLDDPGENDYVQNILSALSQIPEEAFALRYENNRLFQTQRNESQDRIDAKRRILSEQSEMWHYHYQAIFGKSVPEFAKLRKELQIAQEQEKHFQEGLDRLQQQWIRIIRDGIHTLYDIREAFIWFQKMVNVLGVR